MKILLTAINAKYIHSNLAVYNLRAYAAHYAKGMADSDTVEIGEYTINNQMEDILEESTRRSRMFLCFPVISGILHLWRNWRKNFTSFARKCRSG